MVVEHYVSENPPELEEYVEPPEVPPEKEEAEKPAEERAYSTAIAVETVKSKREKRRTVKSSKNKKKVARKQPSKKAEKRRENDTSDLLSIKGIGPKTLAKLKKAGIISIEDLRKADPDEVAKKTGISPKILRKFIAQVK